MLVALDIGYFLRVLGGNLLGLVHADGFDVMGVLMRVVVAVFMRMLVVMPMLMIVGVVMLVVVAMLVLVVMVAMVVRMLSEGQGVDDIVLVLHGLVEPGIIATAAGDDDIGLVSPGDVGRGGLEVVWVHVVAGDDSLDVNVDVSLRGIDHCLCHISPDGRRGDDVDGLLIASGPRAAVGVVATRGAGGQRCSAEDGSEKESGGSVPSMARERCSHGLHSNGLVKIVVK